MLEFPVHRSSHLFNSRCEIVSVLGTVHHHRHRWNPFSTVNDMHWNPTDNEWEYTFFLQPRGGRHGNGIYSLRFVANHNPARVLKLGNGNIGQPEELDLIESRWGEAGRNISLQTLASTECRVTVTEDLSTARFHSTTPGALKSVEFGDSFELNGFVWDDDDMFNKYQERQIHHRFIPQGADSWAIELDLRKNGGIIFRSDGVYQFLISANGDEDQGLSALNHPEWIGVPLASSAMAAAATSDSEWIDLVQGTGFGSSHGRSLHSAPTIKVSASGRYRFLLKKFHGGYRLKPEALGSGSVELLNTVRSVQILGSIHPQDPFNPLNPKADMLPVQGKPGEYERELGVTAGSHVVAFALDRELFLDTMGLGCWIRSSEDDPCFMEGMGWHGKPNEPNISFIVEEDCRLRFTYDLNTDSFTIREHGSSHGIRPVRGIESLSLVGNFGEPLASWDPKAAANRMSRAGHERFERFLFLNSGQEYSFKFVANSSDWQLVFADYELDGYGMSLPAPCNPKPWDSTLADLKKYGQLTTHGNPPPLSYSAKRDGWHRFFVDLHTGAYAIHPVSEETGATT